MVMPFLPYGIQFACRSVVIADADIRPQLAVFLCRKPIKTRKILRASVHSSVGAVLVDAPHLPRLKPQTEKHGGVRSVRVEGLQPDFLFRDGIVRLLFPISGLCFFCLSGPWHILLCHSIFRFFCFSCEEKDAKSNGNDKQTK